MSAENIENVEFQQDSLKKVLPLLIAHGNNLFMNKKNVIHNTVVKAIIVATFENQPRVKRRRIVGYVHLVQQYMDDDFKSHFRLTRTTMELLCTLVGSQIIKDRGFGRPRESPKLQVLVAVWVLANQESYRSIADRFDIAKATVYKCLMRVCDVLNGFAGNIVKWPEGERVQQVIAGFHSKKGFDGVIGAIDGTHIDILPPHENAAAYVNRKGKPSMLLQGVCDHKCLFIDCFVGFPGAVHDARVFTKSGMFNRCTQDIFFPNNSHLLGDSAYPLGKHILVPFKDNGHLTRNQIKYNIAHAATRATIERAFGILKGRWRRLKYLELHHSERLPSTISAACVLHNFCISNNDNIDERDIVPINNNENLYYQNDAVASYSLLSAEGNQKRNIIMNSL